MALFGKKSNDAAASGSATAKSGSAKKGGLFGRKKGADTTPDTSGLRMPGAPASGAENEFGDFSEFTMASSELGYEAPVLNWTAPRPKVLNGTSVGLNIGNASIKVVELQSKGGNVSVTGIGQAPTPAESISNGVVMSVGALQHAIREAFKTAGIKSKGVTISVSGTGALVVRVIEVPRMSDAELAESMKQDVERYIPFPPSEVIMDYKALRELPAAPDSPNMDVLLAAAQREIIDLNISVLDAAKLNARAIEVEPLAVARALAHAQVDADGRPAQNVDYARVTAAINIGATGTEISVLRGDVLVFTRTIPNGGNALTQALVDYLGLPFADAERVKHDWGDALTSYQATTGATDAATGGDDWSDFGAADDFATPNVAADATPDATTDPFDEDFFAQGPQDEPNEQHGQKQTPDDKNEGEPDAFSFDFPDIGFADETAIPEETVTPTASTSSSAPTGDDFNFDLDAAPAPNTGASAFSFNFEEPTTTPPTVAASTTPDTSNLDASAWDLNDLGVPVEDSSAPAAEPSKVDLGKTANSIAATTPLTDAAPANDLDLDNLFGNDAAATPSGTAPNANLDFDAFATPTTGDALGTDALTIGALGNDFDAGMDDFGVGLGNDGTQNVDAATVYSILHPLLDELAGEIRRSLEYHASRYPDAVVQSIEVVGGGAKFTNIDVYLTQMLGIPTIVGNPMRAMAMKENSIPPHDAPLYAVAAGLALRDLLA